MASFPERLAHGSGATLKREPDRLLVSVAAAAPTARDVTSALADADLRIQTTASAVAGPDAPARLNEGSERLSVRASAASAMADAPISALTAAPEIEWVAPVYRVDGLDGVPGSSRRYPTCSSSLLRTRTSRTSSRRVCEGAAWSPHPSFPSTSPGFSTGGSRIPRPPTPTSCARRSCARTATFAWRAADR
jgi:hypothetical protein